MSRGPAWTGWRHCRVAVVCVIGGCAGEGEGNKGTTEDSGEPFALALSLDALGEPGPFTVGFRTDELTYDGPAGPRSLRLALWFPTSDDTGEEVRYNGILEADGVLGGATPMDVTAPLHVYSHGHQGYAESSGFWMEHLASQGFVVAAPDHTGNTVADGPDRATDIYYLRSMDISAVLDHLLAGRSAGVSVSGDGITASGHSFGGYTAHSLAGARYDRALMDTCLSGADTSAYCSTMTADDAAILEQGLYEDRIVGMVSMAPGDGRLFGEAGLAAAKTPVLHMTGTLDPQTGGDTELIWSGLQQGAPEHRGVSIEGGGHMTFTDFSGVLESGEGLIDAELGWRIVNTYALGWVAHQRGDLDASTLFDGTVSVDAAATVRP